MKRRVLSIITALALCLSMLPPLALAAEADGTGLCPHHTEHTAECGYIAPTEGQPCTHEHTEECYTEAVSCTHAHDETCGYVPADPGHPCGYDASSAPSRR